MLFDMSDVLDRPKAFPSDIDIPHADPNALLGASGSGAFRPVDFESGAA